MSRILVVAALFLVGGCECGGPPGPGVDAGGCLDAGVVPEPHRADPECPANQGQILATMHLVVIAGNDDNLASQLQTFATSILGSQWWHAVASEYRIATPLPATFILGPPLAGSPTITDQQLRDYIASVADAGPPADGNTVYFAFLPQGVDLIDGSGVLHTCDNGGAAYHATFDNQGDAYGLDMRCTDDPSETYLQQATLAASHEIVESTTDPTFEGYGFVQANPIWAGSVWPAAFGGELADLCEKNAITEGSLTYQRIWSNDSAADGGPPCMPAADPYYTVAADQDWYPIDPGGSVTIELTGWSTVPLCDGWLVQTFFGSNNSASFGYSFEEPQVTVGGAGYNTIDNGEQIHLVVTATSGASYGDYIIFFENSLLAPGAPYSGDLYHSYPIGVYVQ